MLATEWPLPRASIRRRTTDDAEAPLIVTPAACALADTKARVPAVREASGTRVWNAIVNHVPPPPYDAPKVVPSRAYHKMREMQLSCSLPCVLECSVHLCESPGGFVAATHDAFPDAASRAAWRWHALSLDGGEGVPVAATAMLPMSHGTFHLGDVHSRPCVDALVASATASPSSRAGLVTADGAVDMDHTGSLEVQHLPLLHAQTAAALACLAPGGTFVIKCFEVLHRATHAWLARLTQVFESVSLIKPTSSRATNSERYVVARGFLGHEGAWEAEDGGWVLADAWLTTLRQVTDRLANDQTEALQAVFRKVSKN